MIKKQIENFIKQCDNYCKYANELTYDICVDLYLTMLKCNYKNENNIKNVKIKLYYDVDIVEINEIDENNLYVVYEFIFDDDTNTSMIVTKLIDCDYEICELYNDYYENDYFSHLYFKMIENYTNVKILHIDDIHDIFKNVEFSTNDERINIEINDFIKNKNVKKIRDVVKNVFNLYFKCDDNYYKIYLKMYVENENVYLRKKHDVYEYVILLFICHCNKNNIIINNEMKSKLYRLMCDETYHSYNDCISYIDNLINKNYDTNDLYNCIKMNCFK